MKYFLLLLILFLGCKPAPDPGPPKAKVSFVFHDGLKSTFYKVAPLFAKYGITATNYIISSCIGKTTMPNDCKASYNREYMTWDEVKKLNRVYGFEIGSHTHTHPLLASKDSVDQPQKLTIEEVRNELSNSKAILNSMGFEVNSIAPPYGDYDWPVMAEIAKFFTTMQGFWDTGYNTWPYDGMLVRNQQVQGGVTVDMVKKYIDTAIANKQWLTLTFHEVKDNASQIANAYETSTRDLEEMVKYAKSKNIQIVNMTEGFDPTNSNLFSGGDFESGIKSGWSTSFSSFVKVDGNNNGAYPNVKNSIKLSATTQDIFITSPRITVDAFSTYKITSFVNITSYGSGDLFFYADEFDGGGKLISGKYLKQINNVFNGFVSMEYTPSSTSVYKTSLRIGVRANSQITAFLDNVKFSQKNKNLLPNGGFEEGISKGWTVRNSVELDSNNNGSYPGPIDSIKFISSSQDSYLFSPAVFVTYGKRYLIKSFVYVAELSAGEIYFYVDEYDKNGTWISGRYVKGISQVSVKNIQFEYNPSSKNVSKASIQVGMKKDSGIKAFVDNIEFYQLN